MTVNLTDARALAAITRIEKDRRRWLATYRNVPEEQRALTQAHFDEQASNVLTQTLADAVCQEYKEIC